MKIITKVWWNTGLSQNQKQNRESTQFTEYVIICGILRVNSSFPHFFQTEVSLWLLKKFRNLKTDNERSKLRTVRVAKSTEQVH